MNACTLLLNYGDCTKQLIYIKERIDVSIGGIMYSTSIQYKDR